MKNSLLTILLFPLILFTFKPGLTDEKDKAKPYLNYQGVIINEIMYAPLSGMPEWIELYNSSNSNIDLKDWIIGDIAKDEGTAITKEVLIFYQNTYLILTKDFPVFKSYFSDISNVIQVDGFPQLNNNGDQVFIRNSSGQNIDNVHFLDSWGFQKGVSLERVFPAMNSMDQSNWGLSTDRMGSTPGRKNSIYKNPALSEVKMQIVPEIFSPGGALDNLTNIIVDLPYISSLVTCTVFNRYGRKVKDITNGKAAGSHFTLVWDGKDNSGNIMGTGRYIIYLSSFDNRSGKKSVIKKTVVLARK